MSFSAPPVSTDNVAQLQQEVAARQQEIIRLNDCLTQNRTAMTSLQNSLNQGQPLVPNDPEALQRLQTEFNRINQLIAEQQQQQQVAQQRLVQLQQQMQQMQVQPIAPEPTTKPQESAQASPEQSDQTSQQQTESDKPQPTPAGDRPADASQSAPGNNAEQQQSAAPQPEPVNQQSARPNPEIPITGKNFYEILGVSETASTDEIKKAYRNLARIYHPDKNQGNKVAEENFKLISNAHETLTDERQRNKYNFNERMKKNNEQRSQPEAQQNPRQDTQQQQSQGAESARSPRQSQQSTPNAATRQQNNTQSSPPPYDAQRREQWLYEQWLWQQQQQAWRQQHFDPRQQTPQQPQATPAQPHQNRPPERSMNSPSAQ